MREKQTEGLAKALDPPVPSPCLNKDRSYCWPFKNPNKLNVLSFGGINDLNYNSKDHGKFLQSQSALLPQSKNNITKRQGRQRGSYL